MIQLSDVGKKVLVSNDHGRDTVPVVVEMVIKSPVGTCAIYDRIENQWWDDMDSKADAVRSFMEFSRGLDA